MKARGLLLQGFLLTAGISCLAPSLSADPEIEVATTPAGNLKVGDICELKVDVSWKSAEADYVFPKPELAVERLAMEDLGESSEVFQREGEEWKRKSFRFVLRAILPGKAKIDTFRVDYVDPARQTGGHFEIESREFKIVPDRSGLYRALGIGLAAFGAAAFSVCVLFRIMGRRKKAREESPETAFEDPYLSELRDVHEKMRRGEGAREGLFEGGKLFQKYLSEKFEMTGKKATVRELLEGLEGKLSAEELRRLKQILVRLDEFRYATAEERPREQEAVLSEIIRYIEGKRVVGSS
jgi:hypothetical protein